MSEESLSESLARHAMYHRAVDEVTLAESALMETILMAYGELEELVLHRVQEALGDAHGLGRSFSAYFWCPDVVLRSLADELACHGGDPLAVDRLRGAARTLRQTFRRCRPGDGGLSEATKRMEFLAATIKELAASLP